MKARRFFAFVAAAGMLFAGGGCTKDNNEGGNPGASITVTPNVITSTLADGATVTLTVKSNADWTVSCDQTDVAFAPVSGTGNGTVAVVIPASTTENPIEARNFSINFEAVKMQMIEGFEMPSYADATVSVYQNENGDETLTTNVKAIRTLLNEMELSKNEVDVTEEIAAKTLTGIVVGAPNGGNMQEFTIAIQDNTTEPGAGLVLTADAGALAAFQLGDIIQVPLKDAKAMKYYGLVQLAVAGTISKFGEPVEIEPVVVTLDNAIDYESQYVKFENVTPTESVVYKPWSTSSSGVNVKFNTSDNKTLTIRINPLASFKSEYILPKSGDLCGIISNYNGTPQLCPQTIDDIQLTKDVEALLAKTVTIAEITKTGVYEVKDAVVAGFTGNGVVLTDSSNAYVNVYIYGNEHKTIGEKMTIAGAVSVRQGGYQFNSPYIVTSGEIATVNYGTPKTYAGSELEAFCDKFTEKDAAYLSEYVELKGIASKDGEYYGMLFPNVDASKYEASLSRTPDVNLNLDALDGKAVVLRGLVTDYSEPYLSITTVSVEEDTSAKYIIANDITGVSAEGIEDVTASITVVGISALTATCDGTIVTKATVEGNVITYSVAANTGNAREGWIELSAEGVEPVRIVVKQGGAGAATVSITFSELGFANSADVTTSQIAIDDNVSVKFEKGTNSNGCKYYTTGTSVRCYGGAYFTVSSTSTITEIVLTYGSSDGTNEITTDVGTFDGSTWTGSSSSVKFSIGGTSGNRRISAITVSYQ